MRRENLIKLSMYVYGDSGLCIELPLWSVTDWNKKFTSVDKIKQNHIIKIKSVSAKELKDMNVDKGDIKLLSTGKFDGYTNEVLANTCINDMEVISLPEGGYANLKYYKGKFVNSLNLIASSSNEQLFNLKYVYYYLMSKNDLINSFYRGSGVQHPDMSEIMDITIPIPSINTQNKIVEILDKFISLINDIQDGLPKEIELRKEQYEYYRNLLLNL